MQTTGSCQKISCWLEWMLRLLSSRQFFLVLLTLLLRKDDRCLQGLLKMKQPRKSIPTDLFWKDTWKSVSWNKKKSWFNQHIQETKDLKVIGTYCFITMTVKHAIHMWRSKVSTRKCLFPELGKDKVSWSREKRWRASFTCLVCIFFWDVFCFSYHVNFLPWNNKECLTLRNYD